MELSTYFHPKKSDRKYSILRDLKLHLLGNLKAFKNNFELKMSLLYGQYYMVQIPHAYLDESATLVRLEGESQKKVKLGNKKKPKSQVYKTLESLRV